MTETRSPKTWDLGINKQEDSAEKLFNAFPLTDTTEILIEPQGPREYDIKAKASQQMVDKPSPSKEQNLYLS